MAWRLATAAVTGRPVSGAGTSDGEGDGVAVGVGVTVGVGVGGGVAVGVGLAVERSVELGEGDTLATTGALDRGAAPAAITPAPTPAMAASPRARSRTGLPEPDRRVATCTLEAPGMAALQRPSVGPAAG